MSISSSVGLVGLSRKNALRLRPHRLPPGVEVGAVDQRRGDAEARQELGDHIVAGAEQRARGDDMVAGLQVAEQRRRHRRHAARHGAARLRAFQQAHALLEHGDGRIGVARIDEARILALEARLGRLARRDRRSPASGRSPRTSRRIASACVPPCTSSVAGRKRLRGTSADAMETSNKKPGRASQKHKAGGFHLRPFSILFNVAASRPAKSPRERTRA